LRALALLFFVFVPVGYAFGPSDPFWTLWLYNGTWKVTRKDQPPQTLVNRCSSFGKFFACEQSVNGDSVALLIFVPSKEPGHFFTQSIKTDGRAGGRWPPGRRADRDVRGGVELHQLVVADHGRGAARHVEC